MKKKKKLLHSRLQESTSNTIFKIYNDLSGNKVLSVKPVDLYLAIEPAEQNNPLQEWILYPVDDSKYIIVNLYTDCHIAAQQTHANPDEYSAAGLYRSKEIKNEAIDVAGLWTIENGNEEESVYFKLRNVFTGMLLTDSFVNRANLQLVDDFSFGWNALLYPTNDDETKWVLKPFKTFKTPTRPNLVQKINPPPEYTTTTTILPQTTTPQLTGWTLIPSILIPYWSYNPYFILEKYEYWIRSKNFSLIPYELDRQILHAGVTKEIQTSMNDIINISINEDGGLNFNFNSIQGIGNFQGISSIKKQIINELNIHESQSITEMQTYEHEVTKHNSLNGIIYYANYILTTKIVLKRIAKDTNNPTDTILGSWDIGNPNCMLLTTYQEDPISYSKPKKEPDPKNNYDSDVDDPRSN